MEYQTILAYNIVLVFYICVFPHADGASVKCSVTAPDETSSSITFYLAGHAWTSTKQLITHQYVQYLPVFFNTFLMQNGKTNHFYRSTLISFNWTLGYFNEYYCHSLET